MPSRRSEEESFARLVARSCRLRDCGLWPPGFSIYEILKAGYWSPGGHTTAQSRWREVNEKNRILSESDAASPASWPSRRRCPGRSGDGARLKSAEAVPKIRSARAPDPALRGCRPSFPPAPRGKNVARSRGVGRRPRFPMMGAEGGGGGRYGQCSSAGAPTARSPARAPRENFPAG